MRQIVLLCIAWICILAESGCNYNYPVPLDAHLIAQDFSMPQDMLSPPAEQPFTLTASALPAGNANNCKILGSIDRLPLELRNIDGIAWQPGSLCGALIEIKVDDSSVIKADNAKWFLRLRYSRPQMMKGYSVALINVFLKSGRLLMTHRSEEQEDWNTIEKCGSMEDPISHIIVAISSRSGGWNCFNSSCSPNTNTSSFEINELFAKYVIIGSNLCSSS